ncbi:hypothetical protein RN001_000723 [Aquatica leii]|uniref:Chitin-binding type-2 domain-containing protein n=1 Tax=Aquatica leii TaxID=1421715 RepID=A0AAN7Q7D6_9COLE|nr:hypothetical protein RN001_000723 [Aquatica leii]
MYKPINLLVLISLCNIIYASSCPTSGRKCASKDTFVYCINLDEEKSVALDFFRIKCKSPLVCTEDGNDPCVNESELRPPPKPETKTLTSTTTTDSLITTENENLLKTVSVVSTTSTTDTLEITYINNSTVNQETTTEIATSISTLETDEDFSTTDINSSISSSDNDTETSTPTEPSITCPNPPPAKDPNCKKFDEKFRGPDCISYYRCVPSFFSYRAELIKCAAKLAYSPSQEKCVDPPKVAYLLKNAHRQRQLALLLLTSLASCFYKHQRMIVPQNNFRAVAFYPDGLTEF